MLMFLMVRLSVLDDDIRVGGQYYPFFASVN